MPFGEEIVGNVSGRQSIGGYGASDGIRQKFTQYLRDDECGLDYAGARYYSSVQCRFTSVDPIVGNTLDPQTLNRYSYVADNPLTRTDPGGLYPRDQHQFITFLMAAMLDIPDAAEIGRGAGDADNWLHATTGLGIPIPGAPFSLPPIGWPANFRTHFGLPPAKEELSHLGPYKFGFGLHLVEDNSPGGPHRIVKGGVFGDGSSLFARIASSIAHVGLSAAARVGLGTDPDRDPKRQAGWEAAWDYLSYKYRRSAPYPKGLIESITGFLNSTGRTVVGIHYQNPQGRVYVSGKIPPLGRLRLVRRFTVDGTTVSVYEERSVLDEIREKKK
jgi:RHS repeat-associated protein